MDDRINRPQLSWRLLCWGVFCLFGVGLGIEKLTEFRVGADGWQAGLLLVALCVFGWVLVAAIVWFGQQEVAFEPDALMVRRWTDILLDRSGRRISRRGTLQARIFKGGLGYSAVKFVSGADSVTVELALWNGSIRQRLPEILEGHGLSVEIAEGSDLDD